MEIQVKQISKSDFNELSCYNLFENKLTDKAWGIVTNGVYSCKFGWQSDTLTPFILKISEEVCLIGIDQSLVLFDFFKKQEIFKVSLDYFFYEAIINREYIYAITELEILKIDLKFYKIVERYELPDYFKKIEFNKNSIKIHCVGDEKITI